MAISELRPGEVFFWPDAPTERDQVLLDSALPSGAVWADDSDATFVDIGSYGTGGVEYTEAASADFPTLPAGLTRLEFRIRWQYLPSTWDLARLIAPLANLSNADDPTDTVASDTAVLNGTWPSPSSPQWWSFTFAATYWSGKRPRVTVLDNDALHEVYEKRFRVFEVMLLATFEAATGLAPLRQDLCRDDSRVGRVWPLSSQQDSLRRLGGYY